MVTVREKKKKNVKKSEIHTRLGIFSGSFQDYVGTWSSRLGISFLIQWWKLYHDNLGLCLDSTPPPGAPPPGESVPAHLQQTAETGPLHHGFIFILNRHKKNQTDKKTEGIDSFIQRASNENILASVKNRRVFPKLFRDFTDYPYMSDAGWWKVHSSVSFWHLWKCLSWKWKILKG